MARYDNCLKLQHKLPIKIVKDLENNKSDSLKAYVNGDKIAGVKSFTEQFANIKASHTLAKATHKGDATKASSSYAYTNRPTDPTNELNNFRPSSWDKLKANMVQRYGSIKNVLKSAFADNELNDYERDVLTNFTKKGGFGQQFSQTLEKVFKTTEYYQFRFKDPIQYIPQRDPNDMSKIQPISYPGVEATSKLDTLLRTAIGSVAYEWIHTDAIMATGQTIPSLKQTFGYKKEAQLPDAMSVLLNIGMNREYLADQFGRAILERINIEPTNKADVGARDRLIKSLGLMTIATLENMKYSDGKTPMVTRQELYNGAVDYETNNIFGLAALKEDIPITDLNDLFYDPSDEQRIKDNDKNDKENVGKKGRPTRAFIKVNTNQEATHQLHTDLMQGKELLNKAPDVFSKVFGTEPVVKTVSWSRIKLAAKAKVGRFGTASEAQTKNLQKNVDVKYTKSVHIMDAFLAITGSARDTIVGVASMDSKLLIRERNVAGINRSIARDIQMLEDHLEQEKVFGSEFFINARFQSQTRMLQTGMSPQNSKIIRNLFSPIAWTTSFSKTDPVMDEVFRQAIALAFDIETLKVGGKENQLNKLDKMLDKQVIKDALTVLQTFYATESDSRSMTEAEQQIVALAVKETGTKVHGLKGLVEYARYLNHTDGDFTTDIYNEMDGVSNGPVISMLMYIRDTTDPVEKQALLASLAMGGISVDTRTGEPNLDELMGQHNLNDAYQRMAQEWAFVEARMKGQARTDINKAATAKQRRQAQQTYNQLLALEKLLGRFTENPDADGKPVNDGIINKLIRKLSKPRTMQTMYGAMTDTQSGILANENVINEGIYDAIEKIIANHQSRVKADPINQSSDVTYQELENILSATRELVYSDNQAGLHTDAYFTDGKLNLQKLQGFKEADGTIVHKGFQLSPKQIKQITSTTRKTYGEAMKQAIENVYAPIIAARKPFKTMNQRAASVYNLVLKAKWNTAIAEKDKFLQAQYDTNQIEAEAQKIKIVAEAKTKWMPLAKTLSNLKDKTSDEYVSLKVEIDAIKSKQASDIASLDQHVLSLKQQMGRLTVEEAGRITHSIAYLIPKIKTPMHVEGDPSILYLASPGASKKTNALNEKDYSDNIKVEQNYANGTELSKGYVDSIPYLASLSVSGGLVGAIQMIDGMIANHMMGIKGVDLLNVHDATVHSIKDIMTINQEANNIFKEIMFGSETKPAYSIGEAIANMHREMTNTDSNGKEGRSLSSILASAGVSIEDQIEVFFADNVINLDTYGVTEDQYKAKVEAAQEIAKQDGNSISYKEAQKQALYDSVGYRENMSATEKQEFLDKMHGIVTEQAISLGEQVTRNKIEIGKAVTAVAQFPNNGTGMRYTSKSQEATVMGIQRDAVLTTAGEQADAMIAKMLWLRDKKGVSGSSATGISNDPNDYITQSPDTRSISSKNSVEVLETLIAMDNQAGESSVQNSDEHIADLKRILHDIVNKVMKPVTFYMAQYTGQNDETRGEYDPNDATIWIQRQQVGQPAAGMLGQGIRMSAAVVYAHELIHHITTFGLKNDPRTARMVSDLYETTREALESKYGNNAFKVFLNESLDTDAELDAYLNDPANAREVIAAKDRWNHLFNPTKNPDSTNKGLDEFVAFGMTDENFKRELSQLAVDPRIVAKRKSLTTIFEKNLQTTLVNIYNMMMDFIQNMFHSEKHSPMVAQELENLVVTLSKIDTKGKNLIFNAAADAEAKATAFGLVMDNKVKDFASKQMNKTQIGKAISTLKTLPTLDNMLSHRMRVAMLWYKDQEQGLIPSIYTEMKGTTERIRGLHTLLSRRNMVIDAAKEEIKAIMAAVNRDWFNRKLISPEKTAVTKVLLKGDISSLIDISSMDAIKGFIESPTKRKAHIAKLTQDLQVLINGVTRNAKQRQQYMTFFAGGVNDIAYGMIDSEGFTEGTNFRNANNLAVMDNTPYKDKLANSPAFNDIVSILDQMISVSSIDYMSHKDKAYVVELMNSNPEAIKNVLINHNNLKKQAADQLFGGKPELMEKGYVKTILNSRIQFEQGTLADEQAFADRGFTRHAYPFKRDNGPNGIDPVTDDIYMYISHNGTINDYLSGIASTTRNKKKGATFYDIEQQRGTATADLGLAAYNDNKAALDRVKAKTMAMLYSSVRTKRKDGTNAMMPAFNTKGEMTTLRYIMSEHTKNTVLQQFSDFDMVLGSMAGQIVDKVNTPVINADLVIALREMWDKEKTEFPEAYVKIGPKSTVKRYRDIYEQFPQKMKDHILSEWGENGMMVSQDVVDLAFGQRKYSITEMFGKDLSERNTFERLTIEALTFVLGFHNPLAKNELESVKGRAVTRAKSIEDFMIQLTKLAKGNIIVRNIRVTWGNHLSNVMYLKNQGIPLKYIMTMQREAFTSALQYQADNDKLQALLIKRNIYANDNSISVADRDIALKNADRVIMRLEHLLANNPSTEMIKAGLLPSIIEDLDASYTHKPHRFGLDKTIETGLSKLPDKMANVGRVVFMTEDTEGFKTLNNMVKMTDYVGRYVLYKHYISKGMAKPEAMSRVQDEFINFAPPTHRMIEYGNAIGAIWFSKYLLRVQKHIKNNVKERPFTTLATFMISSATHGNNIMNSIPFIAKDMSQLLGDPLSAMISGIDGISTIDAASSVI